MNYYQVKLCIVRRPTACIRACVGVETGAISTRFNDCAGDNGYLRLNNVRIPRTHMLMKAAEVTCRH
jgi:hypothetical protein